MTPVTPMHAGRQDPAALPGARLGETRAPRGVRYAAGLAIVALCSAVAAPFAHRFERANLIMVYLLGVMCAAVWLGRGPAILVSILSVAAFDYFFVPPRFTFAVDDTQYLVTFAVMLAAAVLIGTLASRLRSQARDARIAERRAEALAKLTGELVALRDRDRILAAVLRHLETDFASRAVVLLPDGTGSLVPAAGPRDLLAEDPRERALARWSFDHARPAGIGTATLPASRCLCLPLAGSAGMLGVLAIEPHEAHALAARESLRHLRAFANHVALALEREGLAREAEAARLQTETERLRSALLSSVSHDLRTPLAVITGVTSTLLEQEPELAPAERRELLQTAADEASRLNRLVANLLAMTRLESGALEVRRSWHSLEELVGAALRRLETSAPGHVFETDVPADLPLVPVDDVLVEQVLFNLLENAVKHAPSAAPVIVRARRDGDAVAVSVLDRGPGVPAGNESRLFEKFYRGVGSHRTGGVGLGLAICRGIVDAHGGSIHAANRPDGGAELSFTLPIGTGPPQVEDEVEEIAPRGAIGG